MPWSRTRSAAKTAKLVTCHLSPWDPHTRAVQTVSSHTLWKMEAFVAGCFPPTPKSSRGLLCLPSEQGGMGRGLEEMPGDGHLGEGHSSARRPVPPPEGCQSLPPPQQVRPQVGSIAEPRAAPDRQNLPNPSPSAHHHLGTCRPAPGSCWETGRELQGPPNQPPPRVQRGTLRPREEV